MKNKFIAAALSLAAMASCLPSYASSNLSKLPCGNAGTIEERIQDCSEQSSSRQGTFVLVSRSKAMREVQLDTATNLYWSERSLDFMSYLRGEQYCLYGKTGLESVIGERGSYPTLAQLQEAKKNGGDKALSASNEHFWSSTRADENDGTVFMAYRMDNGRLGYARYDEHHAVYARCVVQK